MTSTLRNTIKSILLVVLLGSFGLISGQSWKTYPYEPAGSLISFPKDEGRHISEPVEWWYTVGHLIGSVSGTRYSFMLTYFYAPQGPFQGFRILNVTNEDTGEFYENTEPVNYAVLATDSLNIVAKTGFLGLGTETWSNKTDASGMVPFEYVLSAIAPKGGLNLEFSALKPPLILGTGKFDQGASNYTYYYSQTKNNVTGTFTFNGVTEPVTGTSWIDRQYGTFNPSTGEKYEWFSLQLSNDMDINFWELFTPERTIPDDPKYRNISVYVDENTSYTNDDFKLERLAYHTTPDEQRVYAKSWRLTSTQNELDITFTANHNNTEVILPFRFYEGAITAEGTVNGIAVSGIGFAELLHIYDEPSVTLAEPENGTWDTSQAFTWTLNNPDDGRPVNYNLYYSTDNINFIKTDSGLQSTSYEWASPDLTDQEVFWLKVEAYSVDTLLTGSDIGNSITFVDVSTNYTELLPAKSDLKLYPIPVKSRLYIESAHSISQIRLYNISGKLQLVLSNINSSNLQLPLNNLKQGIYFLEVTSNNGVETRKILIE